MPNTADSQDLSFQPKSEGYSYINPAPPVEGPTSPSDTPTPPSQPPTVSEPPEKDSNTFLTLVSGVLGFTLMFLVFLGILNYFNVISLNKMAPQFLGWLPQNKLTFDNTTPQPDPSVEQQARQEITQKVLSDASYKTSSVEQQNKYWSIKGVIFSYKNNDLELITAEGDMHYILDQNSKINIAATTPQTASDSAEIKTDQVFPEDYPGNMIRGRTITIFYEITSGGKNLVKEGYFE